MGKINAGTVGGLGALGGGLKQLVAEDNGNASSVRLWGYAVVGIILEDVAIRGNPITWMHVALLGCSVAAKVAQKFAEKPAQGVINAKALEHLIDTAVGRRARGGGADD